MTKYDVPMGPNDADANTTYEYLVRIGAGMFDEKRPFGNSDWHHELAEAWGDAGLLKSYSKTPVGDPEDEYFDVDFDWRELEAVYQAAYNEMADPASRADHALDLTPDGKLLIQHPPLCPRFDCKISEVVKRTWLPEPKQSGRYPLWIDYSTGELEYDERRVYPIV